MRIWLDGAILDGETARIDPADRGLVLGDGVFETIRIAAGAPLHLARHLRRLRSGLDVLGVTLPYADAELEAGMADLLRAELLSGAALRLTVTRGPAPRGLWPSMDRPPTVLMSAAPAAFTLAETRLVVAASTRRNEFSPLSRIKSCNYLDSILARREALGRGADDALLENTQGRLAEATAANLFVYRDGALTTPPTEDGALPGVMRGLLIERAGAREARMSEADLYAADAVFLINSLGLWEAVSLEARALPRTAGLAEDILFALAAPEPIVRL